MINEFYENYKKKNNLTDADLIISKSVSNNFTNVSLLFLLYSYEDPNGLSPDKVIANFNSKYNLKIKNKDENGGYVYILPVTHF